MSGPGVLSDERAPRGRLRNFLEKPLSGKAESFAFRFRELFAGVPSLTRLPFGARWLVWREDVSADLLAGGFENEELSFVEQFLRPGMTALDIGAHNGLYTLLASQRVGRAGRVVAFEPSPRERTRLRINLLLNRTGNVRVERVALGESAGETEFYQVAGIQTGCNSLRPPAVSEPTRVLRVRVEPLDSVLARRGIATADFVKLDVEGAEWSVLKSAARMLARPPRPVILAEVQDVRTRPWGYPAREIVRFLAQRGFQWFEPVQDGRLCPLAGEADELDGNFVAVPEERREEIARLVLG